MEFHSTDISSARTKQTQPSTAPSPKKKTEKELSLGKRLKQIEQKHLLFTYAIARIFKMIILLLCNEYYAKIAPIVVIILLLHQHS